MFDRFVSRRQANITKWLLRAYLGWSICADIIVLSGILYLLFR